jgi:hypothetical protein
MPFCIHDFFLCVPLFLIHFDERVWPNAYLFFVSDHRVMFFNPEQSIQGRVSGL